MAEAFAPRRIEQSLTALQDAQPDHTPAIEAAQRTIAECERKLARHRAALEAGADPALVVTWSQEVQQQRTVAQARLTNLTSHHDANQRLSRDDIHAMMDTLGGLLNALRHAASADKAEIYRELGVRLTYNHTDHTVLAETRPTSSVCVVSVSEGGLELPQAPSYRVVPIPEIMPLNCAFSARRDPPVMCCTTPSGTVR